MSEIEKLSNKQYNEQLKIWAATVSNLGVGLFGAELLILWSGKGGGHTIAYMILGFLLMIASGGMMKLMVPEE